LASQNIFFDNNAQEKTVEVTVTMPGYACRTNGMYFIAHSSYSDINGDNNEDYEFFDSATEDLNFRHTWNESGGIVCASSQNNQAYSHEVGGWLRNDGCGNASNVQLTTTLINRTTLLQIQLRDSDTNATWHYYNVNANSKKYFRFHVDINANIPEGNYEICWSARTQTVNELDRSNNFACKPFSFYPNTACIQPGGTGDVASAFQSKNANQVFTVGPNPTHGELIVNYKASIAKSIFTLVDLQGKTITTTTLEAAEQTGKLRFDLSNRPNGIYFVRMTSEDGSEPNVVRLVKQ
jgi:hypothetical protein